MSFLLIIRFKTKQYLSVQIQLLHVLFAVADANECAQLAALLRLAGPLHLLTLPPPAVAVQVDARRRTEKTLLVTVRLLSNL